MTDLLPHPWRFVINEIIKNDKIEKTMNKFTTPADAPLTTLSKIYQALEQTRVANLPFFAEAILERADSNRDADSHQITKISIVNFHPEMSTQLYIETIDAIFTKALDLEKEVEAITFLRRMQNFSVIIDVDGYDNMANPLILEKIDKFVGKYRKNAEDTNFSIEIFPSPRIQYANGRKKLSAKNTADSVKNLIEKRQD